MKTSFCQIPLGVGDFLEHDSYRISHQASHVVNDDSKERHIQYCQFDTQKGSAARSATFR